MEACDYDAASSTIKIEDITSDSINQEILRSLKENDPDFVKLYVRDTPTNNYLRKNRPFNEYRPGRAQEVGWLGYFIGKNTLLRELRLCSVKIESNNVIETIIEALGAHPQLEKLFLIDMNMGRYESMMALVALLRVTSDLHTLDLCNNSIYDEGVEALVGALTNNNLCELVLSTNRSITARGYKSLATLLESKDCCLKKLYLNHNIIRDEGAGILVNALVSNRKLATLDLYNNGITTEGYSSFAKVLCDTSSIDKTFLSNHALEDLGGAPNIPADVASSLALNRGGDKRQVAIKKILKHHQHFDMQPFFEWDLKVLPLVIKCFERADSIGFNEAVRNNKQKLETIYQFVRAMPEVFEPAPAAGEKRKRGS